MTIQQLIDTLQTKINYCTEKDKYEEQIAIISNIIDYLKEYIFLTESLGICLNTIRENTDNEFMDNLKHEIELYNIAVNNVLGVDDNAENS